MKAAILAVFLFLGSTAPDGVRAATPENKQPATTTL